MFFGCICLKDLLEISRYTVICHAAVPKYRILRLLEESALYRAGYQTICEAGEDRIRKAGAAIKKRKADVDCGFRVLAPCRFRRNKAATVCSHICSPLTDTSWSAA